MRRTIEYCRWQASWWRSRVGLREGASADIQGGLNAYAYEHADLEERFAQDLERRWDVIRRRAKEFIDSRFTVNEPEDQAAGGVPPPIPVLAETVTLNLRELQELDDDDDD